MLRLGLTLLAALAVALVLGGCGGADDDKPRIDSKADFIAAADRICRRRDTSSTQLGRVATDADLARLSASLADIYAKAIADLQRVPLPPGAARAGAQRYVQATVAQREPVRRMKAASKNLEAAVKTKRVSAIKEAGQRLQISVNTVQSLGEVADQSARRYGMRNCGQSAAPPVA